jgi:hypothetical protein
VSVVHRREVFAAIVDKQDGDTYEVRVIGFDKPGNAGLGGGSLPNKYGRDKVILPKEAAALMVRKESARWRREPRLSTLFKLATTAMQVPLVDLIREIEPAALPGESGGPRSGREMLHPEASQQPAASWPSTVPPVLLFILLPSAYTARCCFHPIKAEVQHGDFP